MRQENMNNIHNLNRYCFVEWMKDLIHFDCILQYQQMTIKYFLSKAPNQILD